ncbi:MULTISPECIES: hypothetical protein [unclassified Gilliamella]|nr:hypothetical protein [Gilliamella apicola]
MYDSIWLVRRLNLASNSAYKSYQWQTFTNLSGQLAKIKQKYKVEE